MTLPNGWARCVRCSVATETTQLNTLGVCWRCQPGTGQCAYCGTPLEYVAEGDHPYWRHLGGPAGVEHGATAGRISS